MGGLSRSSGPIYRCRTYHQTGASACNCNTISEGPLVSVITRKIRERYLSETALRRKIEAKLAEEDRPPTRRELARLRQEVEALDRKINNAEDTVLEAPPNLRPGLYRKLEDLSSERDQLRATLDSLLSREKQPNGRDGSEVDRAIEALRSLAEALRTARPEDSRELLTSIVTRIELFFDDDTGGRQKRAFSHGRIYVRPDAGESRGTHADSEGTQLITNRWYSGTSHVPRVPETNAQRKLASRDGASGL